MGTTVSEGRPASLTYSGVARRPLCRTPMGRQRDSAELGSMWDRIGLAVLMVVAVGILIFAALAVQSHRLG